MNVEPELKKTVLLTSMQDIKNRAPYAETWTTFEPVSETIVGEVGDLKARNAQHVPAWSFCQVS